MNFTFTKEQLMIQQMAKEFAEKYLEPVAEQVDRENKIPDEILKGLAELDLFGIPYAEEYGGAGGGYDGYVLAMEQISRACSGVAMTISAHSLSLSAINVFGTEEQKKKYMTPACKGEHIASFAFTEPQTGSDPKQLATTAKKVGNEYILNGTKRFISNANWPGVAVIFAVDDQTGKPSGFLVEKFCEGYSISEPWDKIGMHGGQLLDIYLKDVRVPAENMLGGPSMGYPILQLGISFGKVGVSSTALGGILAAYEEGVKYATEKMHRDAPISKFQAVQLRIADMAIKYEAARWLTYRLGCLANNVKDPRAFAKEAALTKTFVCDTMVDVARISIDIHGSYGLMNDYKIAKIYKDAIIGPEIEGVADMQKLIVAGVTLAERK
ncbi:acyl-CoA dehydrogenase family protein [Syntrophomonas palmitatica]|uniref:acyl-CoA dehydrogenase family protein n=1 Tax=Syntrophomonas palmitatica TaxID=402877 RepID=UPI0006D289C6|nr:acyl-CoA dehydrogenase family protein [Syntrophomonas palmitatica]